MKNHILILLITLVSIPAFSQGPLDMLSQLEGTWQGTGYQQMGQQQRIEFTQTEEVSIMLDGKLLVFHGTGNNNASDVKGFEAIGVMYFDTTEKQTYLHAWTLEGRYTRSPVEITDQGFSWGFEVSNGGTVRYVATIDGDTWTEKGTFSPDGTQWYPFMEMNLKRK